ncbi:MAG: hypothetical protein Q7T20_16170 [Saprospiraceae bacterium]|nr:hypothetical protein [Saprospiraceae bacterium]
MLHIYYLFCATFRLILAFSHAAWYFRWHASRVLDLPESMAIGADEKRRLKHYFFGTTYLAALMCCLRNNPLTRSEKLLFTKLSALSCSFDDLVDTFQLRDCADLLWQDNPEAFGRAVDQRGLAWHLLQNIFRILPEHQLGLFRAYMHRVFRVEMTEKQKSSSLRDPDIEELKRITAEKGGNSVLLFRSVLSHPLAAAEENALYQFGHLIQYCDDIFDLWHDHKSGAVTLASSLAAQGDLALLSTLFEQQVAATHLAFRKTPYPSGQVETTSYILHFLVSITRVCLRNYLDLERKYKVLPLVNRTLIVVDMDNWLNRFLAIRFLLRPLP